jgi:anti-sigma factor RsiW
MTHRDVPCQELVELLTDYLDDVMSPDLRADVESHLADCPGCQNALQHLSRTVAALREVEVDQLDARIRGRLLDEFRTVTG